MRCTVSEPMMMGLLAMLAPYPRRRTGSSMSMRLATVGIFCATVTAITFDAGATGLGDHNGDGRDDALTRNNDGRWHYYAMDGHLVLEEQSGAPDLAADPDWAFVGGGDYDGDGNADALLRHADGRWHFHAMNGRERIPAASGAVRMTRNTNWGFVGSADFTGDGRDDVLLRHRRSGVWYLYALNGATVISGGKVKGPTRNTLWQPVGVADLDGDGRSGVLLRNSRNGAWHYYGIADRRTVGAGRVSLTRNADAVFQAVGDFNGDGTDDVLLRRTSDGHWHYAPMNGRTVAADGEGEAALPSDDHYRLAGVGDLNGDGTDDVLLRDVTGGWHYFPMDGRDSDPDGQGAPGLASDWAWSLAGGASPWGDRVRFRSAPLQVAVAEALEAFDDADDDGTVDPGEAIWPIMPEAMAALDSLIIAPSGLRDLTGIEHATDLTYLHFDGNQVADLSPLAGLTELTLLYVGANAVTDVTPLAGLTNLYSLYLQGNAIADVSPLAALADLRYLRLDANAITDISPLAALGGLAVLGLDHNDIADIGALSMLTELTELHLDANRIVDLSPLQSLTNLAVLGLDDNGFGNIRPLAQLTKLRDVYLRGNAIRDLSPLGRLTKLTYLYLDRNAIVELGPLATLDLHHLSLSGNAITDIGPLAATTFTFRPVLDLRSNDITDISPLRTQGLWRLDISSNDVRDISALEQMPDLAQLAMAGNPVTDISPLRTTRLNSLSLGGGAITDFSPIKALSTLQALSIHDSAVSDLAQLGFQGVEPSQDEAACGDASPYPCNLGSLELANTGSTDLSALSDQRLAAVRNLALRGIGLSDTDAVSSLPNVESLDVTSNAIADLAGVAGLQTLTLLSIGNNPITDVEPLSGLTALRSLHAQGTDITEIGPLAELGELHELRLDDADVSDLTPLASLTGANEDRRYRLHLSRNLIADLAPLTEIAGLGAGDLVRLPGNPLDADSTDMHIAALREQGATVHVADAVDIRDPTLRVHVLERLGMARSDELETADMLALTSLAAPAEPFWWRWDISFAPIRSLAGIETAANLKRVHLDGQRITDVSPLATLTNLEDVRLNHNRIEDIGPLAANPGLDAGDVVRLRGNPLNDDSMNTHIPALQARGVVVHH